MATTTLDIAPLTLLDAVNALLQTIGERPVNTLTGNNRLDVTEAIRAIASVNRTVQARGWWFNTEDEVLIAPSGGSEYLLASNVLKVRVARRSLSHKTRFYVQRGRKLFDRKNRSYNSFTEDIYLDQVVLLDWDELPETAKLYIFRRAGIDFQMGAVASSILARFTEADATAAWAELLREELEHDVMSLENSPGIAEVLEAY